jgi:2-polyprenyl-6-methoxyphenol hydroxylase-like FAD-dependent oxidoreductase
MVRRGDHAVVIGASIGGLCAARALSDCYRTVSVFDRDTLPASPADRRAVPQGRHLHLLLARGAAELDGLFPGVLDDMADAGVAVLRDDRRQIHLEAAGHVLGIPDQLRQKFSTFVPSRPHLEWQLRRRVADLPNVSIAQRDVRHPTFDTARGRLDGVLLAAGSTAERVDADLVVDASGRGSRLPVWLREWGFGAPPESGVEVGIRYATQRIRLPLDAFPEKVVVAGVTRRRATGIGMLGYEDGTWVLTAFGVARAEPPADLAGVLELGRRILPPHISAGLEQAEPVRPVAGSRFPTTRWRRYDKLRRFPTGIVPLGDAICSSNPTYAQGMTVAAFEGAELRRCLAAADYRPELLAKRYLRAVAAFMAPWWRTNVMTDRVMHQAVGRAPLHYRLFGAVSEPFLRAAESDPVLAEDFLRTFSLLERPRMVPTPDTLRRIIVDGRRRRTGAAPDAYPVRVRSRSGSR